MFLTPQKIHYGTCPYCNLLLNDLGWIPLSSLGDTYYHTAWCPNQKCRKRLEVRVRMEIEVLVEKGEEE